MYILINKIRKTKQKQGVVVHMYFYYTTYITTRSARDACKTQASSEIEA